MRMKRPVRRYELTENEWDRIKDMVPPERTGKPGRPSGDNLTALNGIMWVARSGAAWRDMPERYGSWSTVYDRFKRWSESGVIQAIFEALTVDADMQDLSIDSTAVDAHQHSAGAKKGLQTKKPTRT